VPMFVLHLTFSCLCYAFVCFLPSSGFSAHLHALVVVLIASSCATFARAFICSSVCVPPLRRLSLAFGNFIPVYSLSLSEPLAVCIFIPFRILWLMFPNYCLAPCLFGASFLSEHFMLPLFYLSHKSLRGSVSSRTFYVSTILSKLLVS
jgi:hypothetical protein